MAQCPSAKRSSESSAVVRRPSSSNLPISPGGVHQVEFSLETDDNLPADNVRYFTFKVAEPRKILTITDNPDDAGFWEEAHKAKGEFECDVKTPDQAGEWTGYDAVCLLNVADPMKALAGGGTLWDKAKTYLARGGKLILMPGPNARITAYDAETQSISFLARSRQSSARLISSTARMTLDSSA